MSEDLRAEIEHLKAENAANVPQDALAILAGGPLYWFRDWPNPAVPQFGAGVYTVWDSEDRFIYVGMSGRGITSKTVPRNSRQGLHTRLHSHFGGRRSGDQFCVYVGDRLILPNLSQADIAEISRGRHQMDSHIRSYIHANLGYRFVMVPDARTALDIEKTIRSGAWLEDKPLLNPLTSKS
jgi:hypothetical protein